MLMHTKGILVMTPDSAMVLTGKQSLDYSGGVSAEDNFGIGGYDRIMGPNGQAQYWAPDCQRAVDVLLAHYAHTYRAPGERFPRPAPTDRPGRPRHLATRRTPAGGVHRASGRSSTRDEPGAQEAVRHPLDAARGRRRRPPAAGALGGHGRRRERRRARRAPGRAAGGAAGHRVAAAAAARAGAGGRPDDVHGGHAVPAVVEEDRAGDQRGEREPAAGGAGEPVGLRRLAGVAAPAAAGVRRGDRPRGGQLRRARSCSAWSPATTAGRSWCSPGRSTRSMEVAAVEGSYASVIGGAPAAAVVFAGEVNKRTAADPRVAGPGGRGSPRPPRADRRPRRPRLRAELAALRPEVRSEKLGQVADEFDTAHSIERAQRVGSVHEIVAPAGCGPTWSTRSGAAWRSSPSCAGTVALTTLSAHDEVGGDEPGGRPGVALRWRAARSGCWARARRCCCWPSPRGTGRTATRCTSCASAARPRGATSTSPRSRRCSRTPSTR